MREDEREEKREEMKEDQEKMKRDKDERKSFFFVKMFQDPQIRQMN